MVHLQCFFHNIQEKIGYIRTPLTEPPLYHPFLCLQGPAHFSQVCPNQVYYSDLTSQVTLTYLAFQTTLPACMITSCHCSGQLTHKDQGFLPTCLKWTQLQLHQGLITLLFASIQVTHTDKNWSYTPSGLPRARHSKAYNVAHTAHCKPPTFIPVQVQENRSGPFTNSLSSLSKKRYFSSNEQSPLKYL